MCMACDEMDLFYAYLDAVEEQKRKAQPWECEVTVFSPDGTAQPATRGVSASASKTGFTCDEPE